MNENKANAEIWVSIEGYEGIYELSNHGRVRSLDREIVMINGGIKFKYGQMISGSIDTSGYLRVTLSDLNKKKRSFRMHRLVAQHFVDNPNNLTHVNFKDNDRFNFDPSNLEWTTLDKSNSKGGVVSNKKRLEREMSK